MNVIIICDESNDVRCFCRQVNTFKRAREREKEKARNISIVLYRWQLVINAFTRDVRRCWWLVELCLSTSHSLSLFFRRATINCLSVCLSEYIEMRYCRTVTEEEEKKSPERTNETYVSTTTTPTRRHSFTRCCHNYLSVNAHTHAFIHRTAMQISLSHQEEGFFSRSSDRKREREKETLLLLLFFFFSVSLFVCCLFIRDSTKK